MFPVISRLAFAALLLATGAVPARAGDNPLKKRLFSFDRNGVFAPVAGLVRDNENVLYGVASWGGTENAGGVYRLVPPAAGQTEWAQTILYSFPASQNAVVTQSQTFGPIPNGVQPQPLIADTNGALYGVLYAGGAAQQGLVYRLAPPASGAGPWTFSSLYTFTGALDGGAPAGRLTFDTSGALYGVTRAGGANKAGVVYRLVPDAARAQWTYEKLWDIETPDGRGGSALASDPVFDRAGALYMATAATRTTQGGVIRLVRPAPGETAWKRQFLYRFAGGVDGARPGPITLGLDGSVFGMAGAGGAAGFGQIFRISPPDPGQTGWTKTALYDFQGDADGGAPAGGLLIDTAGALYGSTSRVTTAGRGLIFRLTPPQGGAGAWTKENLAVFAGGDANALDSLTFDANGWLLLAARDGGATGVGAIYNILIPPYGITNKNKTLVEDFSGGADVTPVFGPDGALYGVAKRQDYGNVPSPCSYAYKKIPPAAGESVWTGAVVGYFGGRPEPCRASGSLVFADKGELYGFTRDGGTYNSQGTLYRIKPGSFSASALFNFSDSSMGSAPIGRPLLDTSGAVFGATIEGGAYNRGLVFKLTPGASWTQTIIHDFGAPGDGQTPAGDLIFDSFGAIYGATTYGGAGGKGAVFRITPPPGGSGAWNSEVLFSFSGVDGAEPRGGLTLDTDGSLFGVTRIGGAYNQGTVYRLAPPSGGHTNWTHTVIASFRGNLDGAYPTSGVIIGRNHFLHGTTIAGGASGCGLVYRLIPPDAANPQWRRMWLHTFACGADGDRPFAGLVSSTHGELYGVTDRGGRYNKGELFKLD